MTPQDDKDKKKKKKDPEFKDVSRTRTPDGMTVTKSERTFPGKPPAVKGSPKMSNADWIKFKKEETPEHKKGRLGHTEKKTRVTMDIKPAPKRPVSIKPIKTNRPFTPGTPPPSTPYTETKTTNLKAKKRSSRPRDFTSFGTQKDNKLAKVKNLYAAVNPLAKATKTGGTNPQYGKSKVRKNVVARPTSETDMEGTQVAEGAIINKKGKGAGRKTQTNFKKMKYNTK